MSGKKTKIQKVTSKAITVKANGYNKTEVTHTKGDKSYKEITFDITDKKKFDVEKNLEGIYKKMKSKYKGKAFYIRVMDPVGKFTLASHEGVKFKAYEDYYNGRVKNEKKFFDQAEKLIVTIY